MSHSSTAPPHHLGIELWSPRHTVRYQPLSTWLIFQMCVYCGMFIASNRTQRLHSPPEVRCNTGCRNIRRFQAQKLLCIPNIASFWDVVSCGLAHTYPNTNWIVGANLLKQFHEHLLHIMNVTYSTAATDSFEYKHFDQSPCYSHSKHK